MGKCCLHASLFIFDWIIIKVAGNQYRHKNSDEFDFRQDQTPHFRVTCPWMTKLLLFRTWISLRPVGQSWSNLCVASLGVAKGCIMFWGRLDQNTGVHGNRSPHWRIMGKMMFPHFVGCFWSNPFILADNEDMHKISDEFEFRPDRTTDYGGSCPWASKKFP